MLEAAHAANALAPNVPSEQRPELVPPHPQLLVAQIDPALEEEVLDVAQRKRKPDVHHNHEADHLGRWVEIAEWADGFAGTWHRRRLAVFRLNRQPALLL